MYLKFDQLVKPCGLIYWLNQMVKNYDGKRQADGRKDF